MSEVETSLDKLSASAGNVVADAANAAKIIKTVKGNSLPHAVLANADEAVNAVRDVEQTIADAREATAQVKAAVVNDPTLKVNKWELVGEWFLDRLSERSTWAGLIALAVTAFGMQVSPQNADAIGMLGTLVASGGLAFVKTKF